MVLTLLAGLAAVVFFSLPYPQAKSYGDSFSRDGNLESLTPENFTALSQPLRVVGALLLAIGLAFLLMPTRTQAWIRRFLSGFDKNWKLLRKDAGLFVAAIKNSQPNKLTIVVLLVMTLFAAGFRLAFIERAMGHDEAYTFEAFASRSLDKIISDYHLPNNHVLHTILVHFSYKVFGDAPWAVRLPAFLAGVLLVPAAYLVGRRLFSSSVGFLAAGLVAAAPVMINYSTNARGYTLLALITLLSWHLGIYLKKHKNAFGWLLLSFLWGLGFYTLPIMLYPFGMLWLWLLISGFAEDAGEAYSSPWEMLSHLVIFGMLAAFLAVLFYLPIFFSTGIASFTDNPFVQSLSWSDFWQTLPHRLEDTWLEWNTGLPNLAGFLTIGYGLSLTVHSRISRHRVPLQLVALMWIILTFLVQRPNPWAKIWVYLFPLMCLWASAGWLGIVQTIRLPRWPQRRLPETLAVLVVILLFIIGLVRTVQAIPDQSAPKEIEKTAIFIKDKITPGDIIIADHPWDVTFWYYARRHNIPRAFFMEDENKPYQHVFVIVSPGYDQTVSSVLSSHEGSGITCGFNSIHLVEKIDNTFIYECTK